MKFTVLVHEAEEGGYWAQCLELPGAVSSGETLDEVDGNIRDAIESMLDVLYDRGEDLTNLRPRSQIDAGPSVRVWSIHVPLPVAASRQ